MAYRQPDEQERGVCPQSGERLVPEKVYDGTTPDGKTVPRAILKKHHHMRQECPYSGLPVDVERADRNEQAVLQWRAYMEGLGALGRVSPGDRI